ncbi:hypothetical protein EDC04DRAFT_170198 [Pisolithus marmoratus]|nr:hypothetical protein EDC04DRAFT_170198 [Pisolithus marmoratus]
MHIKGNHRPARCSATFLQHEAQKRPLTRLNSLLGVVLLVFFFFLLWRRCTNYHPTFDAWVFLFLGSLFFLVFGLQSDITLTDSVFHYFFSRVSQPGGTTDTMATSPSDSLLYLNKSPGLRESTSFTSLPALVLAPHCSHSWGDGDIDESPFIALYSDSDCSRSSLARNHVVQGGTTGFFVSDPTNAYPSSKATISSPEESECLPFYSAQLPCILDSPVVMRREDFACHRPLTPPPTLPYSTLDLPDSDGDVDVHFVEEGIRDSDHDFDGVELFGSPFGSSQSTVDTDLPLSPISPTWESQGPSCQHPQFGFLSDSPPDTGSIRSFWAPFGEKGFLSSDTAFGSAGVDPSSIPDAPSSLLEIEKPHSVNSTSGPSFMSGDKPSSLLEIDAPRPIDIHWSRYDTYGTPVHCPMTYIRSPLLCADDLEAPSSPLPRHTSLPEDDDIKDVQMSDSSGDSSFSPSHPLLGLPGANIDDSLLPIDPPYAPNDLEPLLLIDDPQDIPAVRSPSPDDLKLLSELPPEGSQLFDMRRRYMVGEKTLPDASRVTTRAEAKRGRKRDAERSKEIGTLLCLKFPDKVVKCRKEKSSESGRSVDGIIVSGDGSTSNGDCQPNGDQQQTPSLCPPQPTASMAQLVAQMVFRRNETSRPLPWKKTVTHYYIKSPLSRAVVGEASF